MPRYVPVNQGDPTLSKIVFLSANRIGLAGSRPNGKFIANNTVAIFSDIREFTDAARTAMRQAHVLIVDLITTAELQQALLQALKDLDRLPERVICYVENEAAVNQAIRLGVVEDIIWRKVDKDLISVLLDNDVELACQQAIV